MGNDVDDDNNDDNDVDENGNIIFDKDNDIDEEEINYNNFDN